MPDHQGSYRGSARPPSVEGRPDGRGGDGRDGTGRGSGRLGGTGRLSAHLAGRATPSEVAPGGGGTGSPLGRPYEAPRRVLADYEEQVRRGLPLALDEARHVMEIARAALGENAWLARRLHHALGVMRPVVGAWNRYAAAEFGTLRDETPTMAGSTLAALLASLAQQWRALDPSFGTVPGSGPLGAGPLGASGTPGVYGTAAPSSRPLYAPAYGPVYAPPADACGPLAAPHTRAAMPGAMPGAMPDAIPGATPASDAPPDGRRTSGTGKGGWS